MERTPTSSALKLFRIALGLTVTFLPAPLAAQVEPSSILYARVWNILDADRDQHSVIVYVRDSRLIPDTFDDHDIVITGPNGFASAAQFDDAQPVGTLGGDDLVGWEVRYAIPIPVGGWNSQMNGQYRVNLQPDELERTDGTSIEPSAFGFFQVIIDDPVAAPAPTVSLKRSVFPLFCDPDQSPASCHMRWSASVEGNAAEGTYIREWNEPQVNSPIQFDQNSGVWFVELRAANIPATVPGYPEWLPWLAVVDLAPPFSALRQQYLFHPEPGPATFEIRYQGSVLSSETFTAIDGPKLAFAEPDPIVSGLPSNIVTFKFYMPGGINQQSLGRNFVMEETKPGRPQPAEPRFLAAREEPSGWLAVEYEVFAPTGGWTFEDNGSYFIILKEGSIESVTGELFPSERNGGFIQVSIPNPAIVIRPTLQALPITRPGAVQTVITVTYQSVNNLPIDLTSIDQRDLRLRGFAGSRTHVARPIDIVGSNGNRRVVATYRIPGPTFGFTAGDDPIEISHYARQVMTIDGQSNTDEISLGSVPINIDPDAEGVFPNLSSSELTSAGHRPFRFRVRYHSRSPIDPRQLQTGGIQVQALWLDAINFDGDPPIWRDQTATLIEVDELEGGKLLNATFEISPPQIGWSHLANGPLTVTNVKELTNETGDPARPSETVGVIQVNIPRYEFEDPRLQLFKAAIPDQENRIAAIVSLRVASASGTVIVQEWRAPARTVGINGEAITFLDAIAIPIDFGFAGQIPDFFEERHRYVVEVADPTAAETIVFRLNGEEIVRQSFRADQLAQEDLLPDRAETIATRDEEDNQIIRSILEFGIPDIVIENWGEVVIKGKVLTANVAARQEPGGADPENRRLQHEYPVPIEDAGFYQFILSVNGEPVSEVFFHAIANRITAFSSWLQKQTNTFAYGQRRGESITLLGDLDTDGASDFGEWAFGSDALNPSQQPSIDALIMTSNDGEELPAVRFVRPDTALFFLYRLERSSNLDSWEVVPEEDYEFSIKNGSLQETTITITKNSDSFRNHYLRMSAVEQ